MPRKPEPHKTKQDRIIELLGAICERLDKLLDAQNRTWPYIPIAPMPPPAAPYPIATFYGPPPGGTVRGPEWDGFTTGGTTDAKA